MKDRYIYPFLIFLFFSFLNLNAQSPEVVWDIGFGGIYTEGISVIKQVEGEGYILGGSSDSPISGNKTADVFGTNADYWVIKVDESGNEIWQSVAGGTGVEELSAMVLTSDGGILLGGRSNSGISGNKTADSFGTFDYWVVKMDSLGNVLWDKNYGGADADILKAIQPTQDGGFILGGISQSNISGNKTEDSKGSGDMWILKIDVEGNILWQKTIGGALDDELYTLEQTIEGDIYLGGYSESDISGDKTEDSRGEFDYWILKLDAMGDILWQKTFGGEEDDFLTTGTCTKDGGYIFAGESHSGISGDKLEEVSGATDYWVGKLDATGNVVWQNTIGGDGRDLPRSIKKTSAGSYLLGGYSNSGISGDKTEADLGDGDFWIVMMDEGGDVLWDKTMGTDKYDAIFSIESTSDNGFILGGHTGNVFEPSNGTDFFGWFDYKAIKLAGCIPTLADVAISKCGEHLSPNGDVYSQAGNYDYTYVISNSVGCDSIIYVNLTINEEILDSIQITACDEYVAPSGIVYYSSGMYTDILPATNSSECDTTYVVDLSLTILQPSVFNADTALIANQTNANYQWVNCDTNTEILGATSQSFVPSDSGNYAVIITQSNCTKTSECVEFITTSTSLNPFEVNAAIFPNPTSNKVWVDLGKNYDGVMVSVSNLLGQKLLEHQYNQVNKIELDWEGDRGIYLIELRTSEATRKTMKVVRK